MKNITTTTIANTTTALVAWSPEIEAKVIANINAGRSAFFNAETGENDEAWKVAAKSVSAKKVINQARAARKTELMRMSGAILGQFQTEGFQLVKCSEIKTNSRTGDQSVNLRLEKKAETEADKLRKELEAIRKELSDTKAALSARNNEIVGAVAQKSK